MSPVNRRTTGQLGNTCISKVVMCALSSIEFVKQPFHEADRKNQYIESSAHALSYLRVSTVLSCQWWRTLAAEWSLFACGTL